MIPKNMKQNTHYLTMHKITILSSFFIGEGPLLRFFPNLRVLAPQDEGLNIREDPWDGRPLSHGWNTPFPMDGMYQRFSILMVHVLDVLHVVVDVLHMVVQGLLSLLLIIASFQFGRVVTFFSNNFFHFLTKKLGNCWINVFL